eukprot:13859715-Alexandrium_andersonii.AAC.1
MRYPPEAAELSQLPFRGGASACSASSARRVCSCVGQFRACRRHGRAVAHGISFVGGERGSSCERRGRIG